MVTTLLLLFARFCLFFAIFSQHAVHFSEINQNHLKRIEGLRFQGLVNLLSLRLRRNQLSELMDGAFFGLAKIETLLVVSKYSSKDYMFDICMLESLIKCIIIGILILLIYACVICS